MESDRQVDNPADRFEPPRIFEAMADALPTHQKGDESSDLASSYEAVALLIHALLATLDFRLYGFNEDEPLPECESLAPRLPPQWNQGFGSLSFAYRHKQSAMRFIFRIDRMGAKFEVRGLAVGHDHIYRLEEATKDIIDSTNLPVRIAMTKNGEEDRKGLAEKLEAVFKPGKAKPFLRQFRVRIVEKLIPMLQKEGYEEIGQELDEAQSRPQRQSRTNQPRAPSTSQPQNPAAPIQSILNPQTIPYPVAPVRPLPAGDMQPPGFEDEYEINRPPRGGMLRMPPGGPYGIGHDDLNPQGLGPHDPLRGSFVGGQPQRPGGFSGMHPTFDDPLFTGQGRFGGVAPHPNPPPGAYNPQLPPGARWDPVGPGGNPRFPGQGNGRGNNPYGSFGGDNNFL